MSGIPREVIRAQHLRKEFVVEFLRISMFKQDETRITGAFRMPHVKCGACPGKGTVAAMAPMHAPFNKSRRFNRKCFITIHPLINSIRFHVDDKKCG